MGKRDSRVDAYIKKAAPFAQPILIDIRDTVHAACPDVEEAMKWSFPGFMYNGMLCSVASSELPAPVEVVQVALDESLVRWLSALKRRVETL